MEKLFEELKKVQARLSEINSLARDEENRSLTEDEQKEWDELIVKTDGLRSQIEEEKKKLSRTQSIEDIENLISQPVNTPHLDSIDTRKTSEFSTLGEFIYTVRFRPGDERLIEVREQTFGVGAQGGFLVPEQFTREILSITPQDAIFRPRATVIPAGIPPDAAITIPTLDQAGTKGVYAGVTVNWIAEGADKGETQAYLKEVKLDPNEVAGYIVATDKLLRNAPAATALIQTLLRRSIIAAEEDAFLAGSGVGKPLGILASAATLAYNRATANEVAYGDVAGMYGKAKFGGPLLWIGSQSILPQLLTMKDPGNHYVWQPNAREGAPGTLLGLPLVFNNQSPTLGSKGDLTLVDLQYYMIKDGAGIVISASEHVYFKQNKTVIKAFWNVDGQPWLSAPLTLEDGSTQVSPFVVLDVPS
jgi:HK97 family phage major capsid protein